MMILVDCFVNREYIGGYIELYMGKAKTLTLNLLGVLIEMYIIIILIDIQIFVRQIGPHLKVNFNPIMAISTIIVHMSTCLCICKCCFA